MVKNNNLSAGYGVTDWLYQRITAIIMLIAIILFSIFIFLTGSVVNSSFGSWQQLFGYTVVKIFTQIVFVAIMIHAWIGIRDLWMDYVKCYALRIGLYTLTVLWLLGSFIYSVKILWI